MKRLAKCGKPTLKKLITDSIARKFNLTILHNIATDGLKSPIYETLNSMTPEVFERYMNYHYQICEIRSLLGYSEHTLIICSK